ncbi:hypothetical protein MGG_16075 [Pyricularia oryzae 70-15]|uniref:Uncharacterized protein n=1 Tax=Pyricularia oryzae (strain 70-15 / ATCC MYA-4617 / FGSC 8958) TaxID=242507 RepID=G4MPQ5_PYRO7|nr:uncharacterized protein MGG_16075 [Pyricularia oryzae 70-15]EHA56404.1 hypothetical protein MGG_16075 [Pyricularia oryzae 70-15]
MELPHWSSGKRHVPSASGRLEGMTLLRRSSSHQPFRQASIIVQFTNIERQYLACGIGG